MTNKEKYILLCRNEPSICIYDQAWWLDIDCGEQNWDVLLYEKAGSVVGALPYYVKKKHNLKYITMPFRSQHHGIWIRREQMQTESRMLSGEMEIMTALVEQLEQTIAEQRIVVYQQALSPDITNWLPFYWRGYQQTTKYTYRIEDISDPTLVFSRFEYDKRKSINKAKRNGVEVRFDLSAKDFYLLHQKCLDKEGKKIKYSFDMLERFYKGVYSHNAGRTIYALDGRGKIISALFNAWDQTWGYDWISAIDPDSRSSGAADLLVYSMIEYLTDRVTGYDFEGSMVAGVERSFRHFGAKQTPYFFIHKAFAKNGLVRAVLNSRFY